MTNESSQPIRTGSVVEVWNRSLGHFGGRFEVAETVPGGVRVRRISEQVPLPVTFTADEVRLVATPPPAWDVRAD